MERIDKTHSFGFPGVWIPVEVMLHPALSRLEQLLFGVIQSLNSTTKGCWASNRYLSSIFKVTPQTISKSISTLSEFNFLYLEYKTIKDELYGKKQVRTIRIDDTYADRYKGLKNNIFESLENDVHTLNVNLKTYEKPLDPLKENLNSPLKKTLSNSTINKSNNIKKINKKRFSLNKSFSMFSKEQKESILLKTEWKEFWDHRKEMNKPLTVRAVNLMVKKFSTSPPEEIIQAIHISIENSYTGLFLPNKFQKGGNGNGGNGNGKQPEPIKIAKLIIDAFEMESPNIKRLNTAVQETEAYLDKWAEYWHKQRKGKEWHECPNWSMSDYIPSAEQLYIKYIESLSWVNGQPNEALFDFGNTQFIKFRKQYQKRISGVNWETGGSL